MLILLNWLNNQSRWSDLGHLTVGYFICNLLGSSILVKLIFTALVIVKEFLIDKHNFKQGLIKIFWYLIGIVLA